MLIATGVYLSPELIKQRLVEFQMALASSSELISTIPNGIKPQIFIDSVNSIFIGKSISFFLNKYSYFLRILYLYTVYITKKSNRQCVQWSFYNYS